MVMMERPTATHLRGSCPASAARRGSLPVHGRRRDNGLALYLCGPRPGEYVGDGPADIYRTSSGHLSKRSPARDAVTSTRPLLLPGSPTAEAPIREPSAIVGSSADYAGLITAPHQQLGRDCRRGEIGSGGQGAPRSVSTRGSFGNPNPAPPHSSGMAIDCARPVCRPRIALLVFVMTASADPLNALFLGREVHIHASEEMAPDDLGNVVARPLQDFI